jgi:hypothetical protein
MTSEIARGEVMRQYDRGLSLLGVAYFVLERKATDSGKYIRQWYELTVPAGTKAIDVQVMCMDVAFGERDVSSPQPLSGMWYEVRPDLDDNGILKLDGEHCTFVFEAGLQNSPTVDDTAPWSARFVLQVKCFGT